MIRRPPRSTLDRSSAASDVYKRQLNDFYLPGRDYSKIVEVGGVWMLILTLLGVLAHGAIRIVLAVKSGKGNK